jgi:hypothetical protein
MKPLKGLEKLLEGVAKSGDAGDTWNVVFTLRGGRVPQVSDFALVRTTTEEP